MRIFLVSTASLILFAAAQAPVQAQDLPEGKGKDVVEKTCAACHGLDAIVTMHAPKDAWSDVVNDMKSRGAEGSAADFDTIIAYLGKYFGEDVNVNKAAAKDLLSLDLTADEAAAIVKARPADGFKTLADLGKVPGIDVKKLEPLKDRIKFQ
jgi:mono/diheme cytochrome c family protein